MPNDKGPLDGILGNLDTDVTYKQIGDSVLESLEKNNVVSGGFLETIKSWWQKLFSTFGDFFNKKAIPEEAINPTGGQPGATEANLSALENTNLQVLFKYATSLEGVDDELATTMKGFANRIDQAFKKGAGVDGGLDLNTNQFTGVVQAITPNFMQAAINTKEDIAGTLRKIFNEEHDDTKRLQKIMALNNAEIENQQIVADSNIANTPPVSNP